MESTVLKIGIIGFGNLMESLLPCCDSLLDGNREGNIYAVKGSAEGLAEKQAYYNFPITAGNPLEMLENVSPQVILFSPPPTLAETLTETVLKPYYNRLRDSNQAYPLLICFPPKPLPRYYRKVLGNGISQISLMPCVVQKAGGFSIGKYGYSLVSMDGKAMPNQEHLEQLVKFTKPIGTMLNVSQDDLMAALSGMVAAHNIYELCFTLQRAFQLCGQTVELPQIASEMRFELRKFAVELPKDNAPGIPSCRQETFGSLYRQITDISIRAWYEGLCQFATNQGLDLNEYSRFLRTTLDVLLMSVQEETPEHLREMSEGCATKGGLLEKALQVYFPEIERPLIRWIMEESARVGRDSINEERAWPVELVNRTSKVVQKVFERGNNLI